MRYRIAPGRSRVECLARSAVHDTRVVTDRVSGLLEVSDDLTRLEHLAVEVDVRSLDAGDFLRNRELHAHLETARNPLARLTLAAPAAIRDGAVSFAARLEYRGQTVRYDLRTEGEVGLAAARGTCRFVPRFTEYAMRPPKVLFLKMEDAVEVQVRIEADAAAG